MQNITYQLVQSLVSEEIERLVMEARGEGRILHAGRNASRLLRTYPYCGMTPDVLVNQIGASAAKAGVPVELSRAEELPSFSAPLSAI
jgi:hypothetical protein